MTKERLLFLGMLKAAKYRKSTGVVVPDTGSAPSHKFVTKEMIDLEVVVKAQCLAETVESILRS